MTAPTGEAGDKTASQRARDIGRTLVHLPIRYCVTLGVLLVPPLATMLARWALDHNPSPAEVAELGYGWPALEAGRWWTLVTGAVVSPSLAISFIPSYTFLAVALLEHKARHWRTLVALVGGQIGGVLLGLLVTIPWRGSSSAFAVEVTQTVDFGISVGGFACLGAWSCYLKAPLRRPLRWGVACYLIAQLLLSGLIFDVSHPMGWILGVVGGTWLMRPQRLDRPAPRVPTDVLWIALGVVLGSAVGIVAGWNGGGVGGIFGWGP